MDAVFSLFERFLVITKKFDKWYDMHDDGVKRVMDLYKTGYFYPLAERDENGRRVNLFRVERIDPEVFTSADAARWVSTSNSARLQS